MKFILFSLFFFIIHHSTHARWASKNDMSAITNFYNQNIVVNKDATYTSTIEFSQTILKEEARRRVGTFRTKYNANASKFEILEAFTKLNGKKFPVDKNYIEIKPLASARKGFDQQNQVLIAYPNVAIGAQVYLKYKVSYHTSPYHNFFSNKFVFGYQNYIKNKNISIQSKLPLFFEHNDPNQYLKLKKWRTKENYFLQVSLNKPVVKLAVDEFRVSYNSKSIPWLLVSSSKNWEPMIKYLKPKYEAIAQEKLPKLHQEIYKIASKQSNTVDIINTVTSKLSEYVHYMGDWRPRNGGFIPRDLHTIASTKFGDCKDYSISTIAILRKLGLEANIAFVFRKKNPHLFEHKLPSAQVFNHAIVYVKDKEKEYWIDPTNFASFAGMVQADIVDRPALVFGTIDTEWKKIPVEQADSSKVFVQKNFQIQNQKDFIVNGHISFAGRMAIPITGMDLRTSEKRINFYLIDSVANESRIQNWKIDRNQLLSRITKTEKINFSFEQKSAAWKTNAGYAIELEASTLVKKLLTKTKDRVTDLYLRPNSEIIKEYNFSNISLVGKQNHNCSIQSPWLDISRNISSMANKVKLQDSIRQKRTKVTITELKSKAFKNFQNKLEDCVGNSALVYQQKENKQQRVLSSQSK